MEASLLAHLDVRCHTLSTWYVIYLSSANQEIFTIAQNEGEFSVEYISWYLLYAIDPLMSECLIYQLKLGRTTVTSSNATILLLLTFMSKVGRLDSEKAVHIRLSGDNILEEHCHFENMDGKVTLHALPDAITVRLYRLVVPGLYVTVCSS